MHSIVVQEERRTMEINNGKDRIFTWKTLGKLLFSFCITGALFYIMFTYTNWKGVKDMILHIPVLLLLIWIGIFLLNFFLRAMRISLFLQKKIPFLTLYPITLVHNSLVQLLPFRLGEISFIYLTKRTNRVGTVEAALALFIVRILDLFTVFFLLAISFFLLEQKPSIFSSLRFQIINVLIPGLLLFFFLYLKQIMIFLHKICQRKFLLQRPWIEHISKNMESAIISFNAHSKKIFFQAFVLSVAIWTSYFFMLYLIFRYLGLSLPYSSFLFISAVVVLFASIPIHGLAGFGNVEISWTMFLILFGIEKIHALEMAFVVHIIGIIIIVFMGIIGYFLLFLLERRERERDKR